MWVESKTIKFFSPHHDTCGFGKRLPLFRKMHPSRGTFRMSAIPQKLRASSRPSKTNSRFFFSRAFGFSSIVRDLTYGPWSAFLPEPLFR
ncbi:hypothetical protein CEXT_223521 [Caerostris extrusa]|uniref:Uncharacterized protein n=1 Tax=Caerostris extrusa TaxID=172846 RepID=A0AAV4XTU8_CAEEX|nr:hypothetical protein CEXT_223521 [Caerostris extrusa]